MLRRLVGCIAVIWFACSMAAPSRAQTGGKDVGGRVFEQTTQRGIENLEVKLTPPSNSTLPIRVTTTGQAGEFQFAQVRPSRYLIEVSQGPNLLYRSEIDSESANRLEISLQRR